MGRAVEIGDLNAVRNNFGETGNADGTVPGDAVPWDGVVDIADFSRLVLHFDWDAETVSPPAVPEPAGVIWILAGLYGQVSRRGNRVWQTA